MLLNKNSKVLILGRGLLGSAFIKIFTDNGFSNFTSVNKGVLDLTNQQETLDFFKKIKPNIVINAAGKVGGIVANRDFPADFISTNISIQLNVIQAAEAVNVDKFIFLGSSCMYPKLAEQPMQENILFSGKPEETSLAYAVSKIAGLQMCLAFNQQLGITRYVPVIPNSVYGPNDNFNFESGHVLSVLIKRFHEAKINNLGIVTLWGNGSSKREFIHSSDVANACLHLLQTNSETLDFPINIGVGEDIAIKDLALLIAEVIGYGGILAWDESKPNGAPRKLLDSSKINNLGWSPRITLRQGILETYDWYKKLMK